MDNIHEDIAIDEVITIIEFWSTVVCNPSFSNLKLYKGLIQLMKCMITAQIESITNTSEVRFTHPFIQSFSCIVRVAILKANERFQEVLAEASGYTNDFSRKMNLLTLLQG